MMDYNFLDTLNCADRKDEAHSVGVIPRPLNSKNMAGDKILKRPRSTYTVCVSKTMVINNTH